MRTVLAFVSALALVGCVAREQLASPGYRALAAARHAPGDVALSDRAATAAPRRCDDDHRDAARYAHGRDGPDARGLGAALSLQAGAP